MSFEEFINLFNQLSNNIDNKFSRNRINTFTDKEFIILKHCIQCINSKSDILDKYVFKVNNSTIINLLICDNFKYNGVIYKISHGIFSDTPQEFFMVMPSIDSNISKENLYKICYDLINIIGVNFITRNIKYMILDDNKVEELYKSFPNIFAYCMVDFEDNNFREEYKKISNNILKYSVPNYDYIKLIPDKNLLEYLKSIIF